MKLRKKIISLLSRCPLFRISEGQIIKDHSISNPLGNLYIRNNIYLCDKYLLSIDTYIYES